MSHISQSQEQACKEWEDIFSAVQNRGAAAREEYASALIAADADAGAAAYDIESASGAAEGVASGAAEGTASGDASGTAAGASPSKPRLRVVFGGMDGRFSTVPLRFIAKEHEIVGIVHSSPRPVKRGFLLRYARAGQGEGNLQRFADYYHCPFLSIGRAYGVELLEFLRYLRPDVLCLSNFAVILPPSIYEIPRLGALNLHLSRLPAYRGPMPWLWMFRDGATSGACTVYKLDEGEDSGPIVAQRDFAIPANITGAELADEVLPQGGQLLLEALNALADGRAELRAQGDSEGQPRARYLKPGESLIDWNSWSCQRVGAFLRGASVWYDAFPPIPGFYREYAPGVEGEVKGTPGQLVSRGLRGWVVCRDGKVPYTLRPNLYELGRLALPPALIFALYSLL